MLSYCQVGLQEHTTINYFNKAQSTKQLLEKNVFEFFLHKISTFALRRDICLKSLIDTR